MKTRVALIGTDWNASEYRAKHNLYGGVTYYRLIKPLLENVNDKFEFTYYGADLQESSAGKSQVEFWEDLVSKHDIFVTKAIDNEAAVSNLLFMVKHFGKKIVVDLDDNFFEIKEDQPAHEHYAIGKPKRAIVATYISMVDGVFVSTQPLADYFSKYIRDTFGVEINVWVLPNYNDIKDFDFKPAKKRKDRVTIGWTGSTTHFNDLKVVLPAMERLMKEFKNLRFELVGGLTHEDAPKLFKDFDDELLDRVVCGSGTESWEGFPELLASHKWDIGIAPLTDDEFNRGKSHIKWMEYSTYEIPTVASRVYPYYMPILGQNAIVDGKTGYLCEPDEWYLKLKRLIVNPELRVKIGKQAREYMVENLQYDKHYYMWYDALSQILEQE